MRFQGHSDRLEYLRRRVRRLTHPAYMGTLRRTTPLSVNWGKDRGTPIGRYYIDKFLNAHCQDIRGQVLEIKDSTYTKQFGHGVSRSDVLDIDPQNSCATLVANLAAAHAIPSDQFDCFLLTQTLQYVDDLQQAIAHAHRIIRPGGTVLATVPALRQIDSSSAGTDYWRFTTAGCKLLFGREFGHAHIEVQTYGSVLTAIAALVGMATEDLSHSELDFHDPYFPVIITIRAVKSDG